MSSSWDIFFLSSSKTVGSPDFLSASMGIYSYSVFSGIPPLLQFNSLAFKPNFYGEALYIFPLNQDFIWAPCFKCYDFLTSPFEYLTYIANSPSLELYASLPYSSSIPEPVTPPVLQPSRCQSQHTALLLIHILTAPLCLIDSASKIDCESLLFWPYP